MWLLCRVAYNEIRFHLRKMWSKFGVVDIFLYEVGIYFFRFKGEEGMNTVIENGPWMVNNKPLLVQKWNPNLCLDRVEPEKIPLWVKLFKVPLEAWSVKGISAIASRLGRPIIMDATTAKMCAEGRGRNGYAKVLVEVEAKMGFLQDIELNYKDSNNVVSIVKTAKVEYMWKPLVCTKCEVFGHTCTIEKSKDGMVPDYEEGEIVIELNINDKDKEVVVNLSQEKKRCQ